MVTVVHVAVLLFIIVAGAVKAKPSNLQPFAPFGARGVFSGAAYVYFTYTGFDAVATSAEEVHAGRSICLHCYLHRLLAASPGAMPVMSVINVQRLHDAQR